MNKLAFIAIALALSAAPTRGAGFGPAAKATNEFGIDLYRKIAHDEKKSNTTRAVPCLFIGRVTDPR
jgi:hypothetical protein